MNALFEGKKHIAEEKMKKEGRTVTLETILAQREAETAILKKK